MFSYHRLVEENQVCCGCLILTRSLTGSFYVCIPGIIVAAIYVWKLEEEHEAHLQHVM